MASNISLRSSDEKPLSSVPPLWGTVLPAYALGSNTEPKRSSDCVAGLARLQKAVERRDTGAADGLIGADGDVLETELLLQRRERQRQRDGRAVRVGDEPHRLVDAHRVHAGGDQRHLGIGAVGVALVDDAVAEREQARHVALAVVVVERHERQVTLGRALVFELRRGLDLVRLVAVLELLITARVQ